MKTSPIGPLVERILKSPHQSSPPPTPAQAVAAVATFLSLLPSKIKAPAAFSMTPPTIRQRKG